MSTHDEAPESGQDLTEGTEPQSAGVTRWRTKPVTVEMIQWDGNGKTWCLIAEHGGHPGRPNPNGSLNIWDCREDDEVALERGDWAAIDPNPPGFAVGVYRVAATALEAAYEPVSSAGTPEDLSGEDEVATLRSRLAELENASTWGTSCTSCARVLDSAAQDHERAERAGEVLANVVALAGEFERESQELREQSVRDGLHPALAGGHREANVLRQCASRLSAAAGVES